jgi:hypothetical protein
MIFRSFQESGEPRRIIRYIEGLRHFMLHPTLDRSVRIRVSAEIQIREFGVMESLDNLLRMSIVLYNPHAQLFGFREHLPERSLEHVGFDWAANLDRFGNVEDRLRRNPLIEPQTALGRRQCEGITHACPF